MSRFNLIDEPWIPLRTLDGKRVEWGLRDTLMRATEIAVIEDSSPLVVVSLHRFLLAVLYRALEGPADIDQAKAWFKSGIPGEQVDAYLERWRSRFWLFDEKYPFGQNPNVAKSEIEPWTKLTAEHNANSNKVLFDHVDTKSPGTRPPNGCARWLLSTMNFSLSGGRGYFPSPSANSVMCIPVGSNLHETLCYNLIPQNREILKADIPLWEKGPATLPLESTKQSVAGLANLYTWPARMILLEEQESGDVAFMRFVAGYGFESTSEYTDPMHPHEITKANGKQPMRFREDRGTWRDFDSLLPDAAGNAPLSIQHAIHLAGRKTRLLPKSVLTLGLRYTPPNANVDFWRMERFVFPTALTADRLIREDIRQLLDITEDTCESLRSSLWKFYRHLLIRSERKREDDLKKEEKVAINKMVNAAGPLQHFWSLSESAFHNMLQSYTQERAPEEIRWQWLKATHDASLKAWDQHKATISTGDAWAIRALVKAEDPVDRKLRNLNSEIKKYETHCKPQEETA
ncbi:MAG: type I-E CRISPR-associated protein Cse1/CasA [Thiobacillus sp. 63-78]|uniref:type I-E CRISPR-associated protein Cse1/CasA n=1 Tax=Thiobacillus sp. 63-78 TaxID=1895859 RepID=UPI0009681774|nr:type I-E CRISPR-associated protein Cse1/CasA [Thiobacillus sp. 63-78]MBN8772893.1 type I-E CRISPR-associated protein Cse1/CasA [Thiobacillus sp.]OJZ07261.1 MAG: type I-E CRISPR-associated protein Cse1/CasA [Thiobacillus sp. 63-78]